MARAVAMDQAQQQQQQQQSQQQQNHGKPVVTLAPDPPELDFMSRAQWETLFALLDAVLPAIVPASVHAAASNNTDDSNKSGYLRLDDDAFDRVLDRACELQPDAPDGRRCRRHREKVAAFLAHRPSRDAAFRADCQRTLARTAQRASLARVLELLGTRLGSLLLTGSWTPPASQSTASREALLRSWSSSRLGGLRTLAASLVMMAQKANAVSSPFFVDLAGYRDAPHGWKPVSGHSYDFLQPPATKDDDVDKNRDEGEDHDDKHEEVEDEDVWELSTDVVIVGSGCGGGVAARNLAEAGHDVVVVEKGHHFPPNLLPMSQEAATNLLFDNGGSLVSDDGSVAITSGGTVNWSVCFRPQTFVREEWSAATGLPLFTSPDLDASLDRVWDFIGASTAGIRHNHTSRVMLDGCAKLGWRAAVVEQNTAGMDHYCGHCHLGCGSGVKRGPAVS